MRIMIGRGEGLHGELVRSCSEDRRLQEINRKIKDRKRGKNNLGTSKKKNHYTEESKIRIDMQGINVIMEFTGEVF